MGVPPPGLKQDRLFFRESVSTFLQLVVARSSTVTCNIVSFFQCFVRFLKKSINFACYKEHLAKAILRSSRLATDLSGKGRVFAR